MANTTISPNMNLIVPTVGKDPGPDWANNINADLSIVDQHNHALGAGVQITPGGLNINSDLTFLNNNATTLRSVRFNPQSSTLSGAADLGCLYENGVDLYYNDGSGNQIRITQSGSVTGSTGTITGLPSGTASVAFAGGVFTFESATNTPAEIVCGSVTVSQQVASGFGVNISANASQASNFDLVLPASLPGSTTVVGLDSSGNVIPNPTSALITTPNIFGYANGSTPSTGYLGEVITSNATSVTLSTGSFTTIVTLTLTPGFWLVSGGCVQETTASSNNGISVALNILGAGLGSLVEGLTSLKLLAISNGNFAGSVTFVPQIVTLSSGTSTKTVLLVGEANGAACNAGGAMYAVRIR